MRNVSVTEKEKKISSFYFARQNGNSFYWRHHYVNNSCLPVKFLSIYIKEQRLRFRALSNGMFLIVRVCLLCKIKRKMHKMPYHFPMCYLQSGLFTRQRLNV